MALYVKEGFRSIQQSNLECSCHESCVFCICSRINIIFMVMPFTITKGTMVHFMTVSLTLWPGCNQFMIRQSLSSLVMPIFIIINTHSSLWVVGISLSYWLTWAWCSWSLLSVRLWVLVLCPIHIAGNRLHLVTTDVLNIVVLVVGTHSAIQITALSVVCFVLNSLCQSTISVVLSF